MPAEEEHRIFISYAHRDGGALAARLQQDLTASGFDAWLDRQRLVAGAVWTAEIEREIDARPVTLALLTAGSYASEICRAEQLRALRKGKRLLPLLAAQGADRPLHLEARQYRDFADSGTYAARFQELLADIRSGVTATLPASYRETRVTYLTAPPRVANYLERPEALRALRTALFAEDRRQPIALTALSGMGGIGKTVLAQALTRDEVVRQAFPDGIVWITAGREKRCDFVENMREVAKALGDDLSRYENALACEHQYRTTIAGKAALIVVDDVWSKADLEPLLAESPRSRFLFTTRDASIGRFVGAWEHTADLLDVAQSRELLAAWAGLDVTQLPSEVDSLIGECGRLPLALSVVGAMLRGAEPEFWTDTLDLLRKADLSAVQQQLPEGQDSFFKAVEVSFRALAPEMQERYKALAVLLEDMPAPLSVLQTLWNATEAEARRISRHYVDRSLAQREGTGEAIRLHDLQLDYVRAQYPDRDALSLIHGALRLSAHVISRDPTQFASQVVGRLLPDQGVPAIKRFTARIAEGAPRPWIRPLKPALHPPGASLICTLEGHSDWVNGVAVSADGRRVISASRDQTLKVWDRETGRELRTLEGHSDWVNGVVLSPDGRLAVSASSDETVKVWDLESGQQLRTLKGHSDHVNGVAVTPDGRRVVSASRDQTLKVWDLETGRALRTLEGHTKWVNGVAVSLDGRRVVSAGDHTLKVWDLERGRELRNLEGHSGSVNGVAVSPDGRRVVSASGDRTLKVWDLETGRELRTLEGHSGSVNGVAVSSDGRRAVSASHDKTLKVWDLEGGRELPALKGHSGWVTGVAVSLDGRRVVSAGDHTLKVWDLERGRELRNLEGHSGSVNGVAVSSDARWAVSASKDGTLRVWNVQSGRKLRRLAHSRFVTVTGVAVSPDGRRAVSGSSSHTLDVWDLRGWLPSWLREPRILEGHSSFVDGVAVTPDGQRAVSASEDHTLKVWDLETGRALRTLEGHSDAVLGVAVSPDGRQAVSASSDCTLKVWDLETGRALRTLKGHSVGVSGVAVSLDGRRAVSASLDWTLKVWDVESGTVLATFTCDAAVWSCAFINDRKLIAGDALGRVHFLSLQESKSKP